MIEMSKEEFMENLKNFGDNRSEEKKFQAIHLTNTGNRMKLFCDPERPTDFSAGPFQSNRFGAVFLIPE
uniref:SERPIN domain-containing protein n=1 Tax=Caenorhabditis tropicalis TaxID=1561998 RepID=A0A1I7V4M7_9PELO